jgi:hypothetical protein
MPVLPEVQSFLEKRDRRQPVDFPPVERRTDGWDDCTRGVGIPPPCRRNCRLKEVES